MLLTLGAVFKNNWPLRVSVYGVTSVTNLRALKSVSVSFMVQVKDVCVDGYDFLEAYSACDEPARIILAAAIRVYFEIDLIRGPRRVALSLVDSRERGEQTDRVS